MPQLPESNTSLTFSQPSTPPRLTYAPLAPPGPNELIVKVHAAAINPVDIQLWANPIFGWLAGKKERGIGRDYAGEIVAVGAAFRGKWDVGDEVFGLLMRPTGDGTFTQYLKPTSSDPIARKPACWSYQEAAAVPLVALTAFACLEWLPPASQNGKRRVVVSGASGGVGIWCVQSKKLHDCHVIGICSKRNTDLVTKMGADEIIDYTKEDVAQTLLSSLPDGRKYDLYIDCVGGVAMFNSWHDLLHKHGAYVTIVGDKSSRVAMGGPFSYLTHPYQILRYVYGYLFGPRYANVMLLEQSHLLEEVAHMAAKGDAKIVVQEVIEGILREGSEAWTKVWALMEEGRVRGKVVLEIEH